LYFADVLEQWVFESGCDNHQTSIELVGEELGIVDSHLLITGAAGYGKTSFCRWHALLDTERFQRKASSWFPVYVALHRYNKVKIPDTMENILASHIANSALLTNADMAALRSGRHRLRVYLDGLDEIPDPDKRSSLLNMLDSQKESFKGSQFIVTGRDVVFCPETQWLLHIQLSGLKKAAVQKLARKWLEDSSLRKVFLKEIEDEHAAAEIMQVPLLATLTLLLFRKTRSLPETRSDLYRIFMDLLCGGWDLHRGVVRDVKFGRRVKHLILIALAHLVHTRRTRSFDSKDVAIAAETLLKEDLFFRFDGVLDELLLDGIIQRVGNEMQFSHLSFQEYLAAQALFGLENKDKVKRAISLAVSGDTWWLDVCLFYIADCPDPHYVGALIRKDPAHGQHTQRLLTSLHRMIPGLSNHL